MSSMRHLFLWCEHAQPLTLTPRSASASSDCWSGSTIPISSAFCRTAGSRSSLYVFGRRLAFCSTARKAAFVGAEGPPFMQSVQVRLTHADVLGSRVRCAVLHNP